METFVLFATGLLKLAIGLFIISISIDIFVFTIEYIIEKIKHKDEDDIPLWRW